MNDDELVAFCERLRDIGDDQDDPKTHDALHDAAKVIRELRGRLTAAEDVCRMYAWSGVGEDDEQSKALYMTWRRWKRIAPPGATNPDRHPHLCGAAVTVMAAERDELTRVTLTRMGGTQ